MTIKYFDRVKESSTTTGTGNFTLAGAQLGGFRRFADVLTNGDTCYYAIQNTSMSEWEIGIGTYNGSNVLARTTVQAGSNGTSAVNFSAGTKDVAMTVAADFYASGGTGVRSFNTRAGAVTLAAADLGNAVSGTASNGVSTATQTWDITGMQMSIRNAAVGNDPNFTRARELYVESDGLFLNPDFTTEAADSIQFKAYHGQNDISGVAKRTFYAQAITSLYPAAGQRFGRRIYVGAFGVGDAFIDDCYVELGGHVNDNGNEGVAWRRIRSGHIQNSRVAHINSILSSSTANTTITQNVTKNKDPQDVTVASTAGISLYDWLVVDRGLYEVSDLSMEAIQVLAIGSGTINATFSQNHTSGATLTAATFFSVDSDYQWGEFNNIVNLSQPDYRTGTIINGIPILGGDESNQLTGSGTTWTTSMISGDALSQGFLTMEADTYHYSPFDETTNIIRAYWAVSITDNTHLYVVGKQPAGFKTYQGNAVLGQIVTNAGTTTDAIYAVVVHPQTDRIIVAGSGFRVGQYVPTGNLLSPGVKDFHQTDDDAFYSIVFNPLANTQAYFCGKTHTGNAAYDFFVQRINLADVNLQYLGNLHSDMSFGSAGAGWVAIDFGTDDDECRAAVFDGNVVMAGFSHTGNTAYDFALARVTPIGVLDSTFGTGGKVTTDFGTNDDRAMAMALQSNGKYVVAGYTHTGGTAYDFALARYNTDGSLDTSFGTGGKVTTDFGTDDDKAYSIAIQNDGKILVAGATHTGGTAYDFAIARYNTNGTLDTTWGSTGKVVTDFGTNDDQARCILIEKSNSPNLAINPNRIIAAGYSKTGNTAYDFASARYNVADGSLDTLWGTTGKVVTDLGTDDDKIYAIANEIRMNGRIFAAGATHTGNSQYDWGIARYNHVNGTLTNQYRIVPGARMLRSPADAGGVVLETPPWLFTWNIGDTVQCTLSPDYTAQGDWGGHAWFTPGGTIYGGIKINNFYGQTAGVGFDVAPYGDSPIGSPAFDTGYRCFDANTGLLIDGCRRQAIYINDRNSVGSSAINWASGSSISIDQSEGMTIFMGGTSSLGNTLLSCLTTITPNDAIPLPVLNWQPGHIRIQGSSSQHARFIFGGNALDTDDTMVIRKTTTNSEIRFTGYQSGGVVVDALLVSASGIGLPPAGTATSGTNYASSKMFLDGSFWNGSSTQSASSYWFLDVGTGTNPNWIWKLVSNSPANVGYLADNPFWVDRLGKLYFGTQPVSGNPPNAVLDPTGLTAQRTYTLPDASGTFLFAPVDLSASVTNTLAIGHGGSGQTTANAALNAFLPSQTGNSGKFLQTNGTNTSWASGGGGGGSPGGSNTQLQYNNGGSFGGTAAGTYATSGDLFTFAAQVDTDVPIVSKAFSGTQSGNMFEAQDSTGAAKAWVKADFGIHVEPGSTTSPAVEPRSTGGGTSGLFWASNDLLVIQQINNSNQLKIGNGALDNRLGGTPVYQINGTTFALEISPGTFSVGSLYPNTYVGDNASGSNVYLFGYNDGKWTLQANRTSSVGIVGINYFQSDIAPPTSLAAKLVDAGTNTLGGVFTVAHGTSGTPAAGFGSQCFWDLQDSTTDNVHAAEIDVLWATATHASRKGRMVLNAWDTAVREAIRIEASGTAAMIGLFGVAAVAQQNTTGTTSGFTAGSGTPVLAGSTFTGNTGSTAYTISDVILALKNLGVLAA